MTSDFEFSESWTRWRARVDLDEYDGRWDSLEAKGRSVHDEADLVERIDGQLVLDAGCGTGRVGAELARRGKTVVGVDNDAEMLAYAKIKPVDVRWELADLATVDLPETFDIVVMAGNILPFVLPASRQIVVRNMANHLRPGGSLVVGSSAMPDCDFVLFDRWCEQAGLVVGSTFDTWGGEPYSGGDYRVSVHTRS